MDGVTDPAMRALQGELGAFSFGVTEFVRVSSHILPPKVFRREAPEIASGSRTLSGMPVQVQILGGEPGLMAESALNAVRAGAGAIDINFGCPAPVVNRRDGGASLLRDCARIEAIVRAVRQAVPPAVPVSAKLRLGWDTTDAIDDNATAAAEGGADWITIHARTREQGYRPPVHWEPVARVAEKLVLPIVANGDIWTLDDALRCLDATGCRHLMLGRGALADPSLPHQVAQALGISTRRRPELCWLNLFRRLSYWSAQVGGASDLRVLQKVKQWGSIAHSRGQAPWFEGLKRAETLAEAMRIIAGFELEFGNEAKGARQGPRITQEPGARLGAYLP
jgi:tRNA-dihydrouridine synthase C